MQAFKTLKRFLPPLYFRHRGYFLVLSGLGWVHLWAAVDEWLPHANVRHALPIFNIQRVIMPNIGWALVHTLLLGLMVWGVWFPRANMFVVRAVCALSATIFTIMTAGFFISAVMGWPGASFLGTGVCGLAAISAVAAVMEPGVNPANQLGGDNVASDHRSV